MEAIIFIGIQASGKSTFYKGHFFNSHIRINLDMLRTRNRENMILDACLNAKQPFVVDNTNPGIKDRRKYIELSKEHKFKVSGYYFEPNFNESVKRNSQREGKEIVPIVGIKSTLKNLEIPDLGEGFDKLFRVTLVGNDFEICELR